MAKKQTRRALNLHRGVVARLEAYKVATGVAKSALIDRLVADIDKMSPAESAALVARVRAAMSPQSTGNVRTRDRRRAYAEARSKPRWS